MLWPNFKVEDAKNLIGLLESNPFCRRVSYQDYTIDPTNIVKIWPKHTKIVCNKFLGFTSYQKRINTLKIISHEDVRLNLYFLPNLKTLYIIANRVIFYGKGSIKNLVIFQEKKDQPIFLKNVFGLYKLVSNVHPILDLNNLPKKEILSPKIRYYEYNKNVVFRASMFIDSTLYMEF